ncbi:NDMA-dependent alcohol dehydrogenase [Pseudonocardia alni]|uniref:S-(Hydroxymethyl)glutathione dehydrogenase/alcohol dehydrogenase n=1 Tax=Pseudonocardia alni TaxID=33907 RepID=A0A852WHJ5_PSEA5|nr:MULTISPECIES: NDMA-dependent alcohol dehydrogenase [Pseudonocardia]MYW75303.1 NDMA-dependent alcohol dehydrogenase [Pseudonocardia sp. SID8383]OJG07102.1 NDMA-dependent alcohol dehydrogenase [Pseudonocardia autotrophica]MCO7193349.1 NDMA-dependent alcohol dehydrogenase [Pseudonocardia sp. McavD-2-B]NYG05026.1 S-(hydroxymethyl)glutathione dehydrogenase/alcohol dehydrogenase [Pseudonocardia antarctica]PKB28926.1 S-(hydroxymethyl)glutathione dehydrogenase/alcohol dehydrogenase [Pseudonocardia 
MGHTRGAIVRSAPGKYEVVDLELDEPRPGEIEVKMVASGLCHSDDHIATGDIPVGTYPFAGGHEGSGIVTRAGANKKGLKEGDHVVFSFLPSCGHCRWCASGMQNLCDLGAGLLAGTRWEEPTTRLRLADDGTPVGQMCGISTFCETTLVSEDSCVKVPDDIPLEVACLVGCGVGTGWGSAVNAGGVQPGHTTIVMGIGGIGINAVQGASHAGAANIIAVDPVALKREKAQELGATHAVETMEEATEIAKQFTNGQGADQTIVTVGVVKPDHVGQAMASIRKAGTVVVTALGDINSTEPLPVSLADVTLFQKRIQGAMFGMSNPNWDILRQLELYRAGALKLDELVTTTYTLDQVATAYEDMHAGKNIRGIIRY